MSICRGAVTKALVILALVGGGADLYACGGNSGPSAPTSVAEADLNKTGEFWRRLTPDLKDELIGMAKDRLGRERPDGAAQIAAIPTDKLAAEINKSYTNESKRSATIYFTYTAANDKLASEQLNSALGQLDTLCSEPNPPPECR